MRIIEDIKKFKKSAKTLKRINSDGRGIKRGNTIIVKRKSGSITGVVFEIFSINKGRYSFVEYIIKLPSGKYGYIDRSDYNNIVKVV